MAFVVIATWKARPGEEGRIREVLRLMSAASRKEPGCRAYQAQVSLQDPTRFLLYERYDDPRAFADHKASEHFQRHVVGDALPYLEAREVSTYQDLED
jgi:(4S)-4-hydroxy-5-phosphonooxypentane-2,3-dione isomerase